MNNLTDYETIFAYLIQFSFQINVHATCTLLIRRKKKLTKLKKI
jgi:hypothetical protein